MNVVKMPKWHESASSLKYGHVIATIAIDGPQQADEMRMAIEAGFRDGMKSKALTKNWIFLRNMRWRAFTQGWVGW